MQKNTLAKSIFLSGIIVSLFFGVMSANAQNSFQQRINSVFKNKISFNKANKRQNSSTTPYQQREKNENRPLSGIVTAVNGNTFILSVINTFRNGTSSTATTAVLYTVDASSSKIFKNATTSTTSKIAVNDKVMLIGDLNGNLISAKIIHIGNGQINGNRDGQKVFSNDDDIDVDDIIKENLPKLPKVDTKSPQYKDLVQKISGLIKNFLNR